jgi:THO complex subunit 1
MRGIADDEFNIGMAQTSEEKDEFVKAKASKMWRTLRLATRSKLGLLDKIDDGKSLKALFDVPAPEPPAQKSTAAKDDAGGMTARPVDEASKEETMQIEG